MLEVMWDMKGDIVTLSSRFSSRMKTLEMLWSTAKSRTRGPTATRNHGKTQLITPRQKKTRITFWMNISAWNGRRVSTRWKQRRRDSVRPWTRTAAQNFQSHRHLHPCPWRSG